VKAQELRNTVKGKMVVVGNSFSLKGMDLSQIHCPTISCNRILKHETFVPTYLMMSDREAYIQERDQGRLSLYSEEGGNLLLSTTIFDPSIKGKRADKDKTREYPAQPEPTFPWYSWRVGAWHTKPNFDTFDDLLCSCANIFGPMLQAAVILGARDIGVVGVDMMWPSGGDSHFYGAGSKVGAFKFVSARTSLRLFKNLRNELEIMGIKVHNLSPKTNSPFGKVFKHQDFEGFVGGAEDE